MFYKATWWYTFIIYSMYISACSSCTDSSAKVIYKKIAMQDGAHHPIEPNLISAAVDWLHSVDDGSSTPFSGRPSAGPGLVPRRQPRVLVNCRAGIGRSGSVAVAYVYASDRRLTFDGAVEYVSERRFVYPHAGLAETLDRLYPRLL